MPLLSVENHGQVSNMTPHFTDFDLFSTYLVYREVSNTWISGKCR
jgi:hypothetical protein